MKRGSIDHTLGGFRREEFGHRSFARDAWRALVFRPGSAIDQQRRRIDVERHVGEMALHHLQAPERCAE